MDSVKQRCKLQRNVAVAGGPATRSCVHNVIRHRLRNKTPKCDGRGTPSCPFHWSRL